MDEVKLDEGLIITYDQEDEFTLNRKRILVRPAWKWMLEILNKYLIVSFPFNENISSKTLS